MTLEELKAQTLPVKLIEKNGDYEITVTALNDMGVLYTNFDGDDYTSIGAVLENFKIAPQVKVVDGWINIYKTNCSCIYLSKKTAEERADSIRLFCKHIKYEVDANTGKFIRELEI